MYGLLASHLRILTDNNNNNKRYNRKCVTVYSKSGRDRRDITDNKQAKLQVDSFIVNETFLN